MLSRFSVTVAAASWCSYLYTLAVLGHGGAGKTTLMRSLATGGKKMPQLPDTPSTVGVEAGGEKVAQSLSGALRSG